MSVRATPDSTQVPAGYADTYYEDDRSDGWVIFSGVLILLLGTLNFIDGLGAISSAHFYVAGARYVVGDLNTWGWVALCIGVAQWAVGLGVFIKNQLARWTGVAVLGLNAIAQLLMMPAYPFWSLCIFALDIIAMYGLVAHGNRISAR
jgi:hypothetical protein